MNIYYRVAKNNGYLKCFAKCINHRGTEGTEKAGAEEEEEVEH
jgi:hypothetical protein